MKLTAQNFSLSEYLSRIEFEGAPQADFATLKALMRRQLRSVAFENTSVIAGLIPSLKPEDIVEKIVHKKRGGYCYELNGLFSMALSELGFEWYFAGARPMTYAEQRPKTHMVVIASVDGRPWLCDCGFGGYGLREPIELKGADKVKQEGDEFCIELLENGEYLLSSLVASEWTKQYAFEAAPQGWIEFTLANYFNATHPDTIFTQKKIAVLQTDDGRKILVDDELKIIKNGELQKIATTYEKALKEEFGLSLL